MPNRILRDWTDSEAMDKLTVNAERFFTRLIMKVDDYGRFSANAQLLKSNLYPLKTDVRSTDVSLWIAECKKCGLITTYSIANKEYLQIENFKQVLRQKKEKYPAPIPCDSYDNQMTSICIADDVPETKRNETESETKGKVRDYVTLTHAEHSKLLRDFGEEDCNWLLDKLNAFKGSKGKKYKSDYLAIHSWVIKALKEEKEKSSSKKESKVDVMLRNHEEGRKYLGNG